MSVAHDTHGVGTRLPVSPFQAWDTAIISNGRGRRNIRGPGRLTTAGYVTARLAATAEWHPCDQAFNATAVWRSCNIDGYLERKLHRQWRTRGS